MGRTEKFACAGCHTLITFIDDKAETKCACFCECKEVPTGVVDESTGIAEMITEACDPCIESLLYPSIESKRPE